MKKITSNCLIYQPPRMLLGMKKRGFGEGRWNGFGGKVEEGETLEQSAIREVQEECGITVKRMELVGVLDFEYLGKDKEVEVNIFKIAEFSGEPKESEEMKPEWFAINNLPFGQMWPDDEYWMPLFLEGQKFRGKFIFEGYDKVLSHEIIKVGTL